MGSGKQKRNKHLYTLEKHLSTPFPRLSPKQDSTCSSVGSSACCSSFEETPALGWAHPPPQSFQLSEITFSTMKPFPIWCFLCFLKFIFRGSTTFANKPSCVLRWIHFRIGWTSCVQHWAVPTSQRPTLQPLSPLPPPTLPHEPNSDTNVHY